MSNILCLEGAMATAKRKTVISNYRAKSVTSKKNTVMRNNQKVASVSLCCKLNMLVPQLQRLNARMQPETQDKKRSGYTSGK
ncbi:hypothetical protein GCM10023188_41600 [Pontibacter saemangeumensis]|uniref:Uncharacterized protein n=1 Tax=Pontibacter saemangeumensis TaxID=1084525 RepID=A0ABP8M0U2_9BACT